MSRKAKILRKTKETNIVAEVNLDGKGIFRTCDTKNLIEQNTNLTGQGLLNQIL